VCEWLEKPMSRASLKKKILFTILLLQEGGNFTNSSGGGGAFRLILSEIMSPPFSLALFDSTNPHNILGSVARLSAPSREFMNLLM
jgi:hypothetical protein